MEQKEELELKVAKTKKKVTPIKQLSRKILQIALGQCHTIIHTDNNTLLVAGNNSYGELGLGHFI